MNYQIFILALVSKKMPDFPIWYEGVQKDFGTEKQK